MSRPRFCKGITAGGIAIIALDVVSQPPSGEGPSEAPPRGRRGARRPSSSMLGAIFAMVLIILATATTTYFVTVDRLQGELGTGPTTVMLAAPVIDRRDADGTAWDATAAVSTIRPMHDVIMWDDVRVGLRAPSGEMLLRPTRPASYSLSEDRGTPSNVTLAWFIDGSIVLGRLDVGDSVKVTGMPPWFEGAVVELTVEGKMVGYAPLPTSFSISSVAFVSLATPTSEEVSRGSGKVLDMVVQVTKIVPLGKTIPWDDLRITVQRHAGVTSRTSLDEASLRPDGAATYDDISPVSPEAWFIESGIADAYMNVGDSIKITGLRTVFDSYSVQLTDHGQSLGHVELIGEGALK